MEVHLMRLGNEVLVAPPGGGVGPREGGGPQVPREGGGPQGGGRCPPNRDRRKRTMIPMKKPLKGGFFAAPISTTAKEYLVKNILEQQKSLAHKEQ